MDSTFAASSEHSEPSIPLSLHQYLSTRTKAELSEILSVIKSIHKTAPTGMNKVTKVHKINHLTKKTTVKRPLNSYMAFRAYYSKIFASQQQKNISGLLTRLWQEEPNKGNWAIAAKAFSVIRDYQHGAEKGQISKLNLDAFLNMICPLMGIVCPSEYLLEHAWEYQDINGTMTLIRTTDAKAVARNENGSSTSYSVQDIITFFHEAHYIDTDDLITLGTGPNFQVQKKSTPPNASSAKACFNHANTGSTHGNLAAEIDSVASQAPNPVPQNDADVLGYAEDPIFHFEHVFEPLMGNGLNDSEIVPYSFTNIDTPENMDYNWDKDMMEYFFDFEGGAGVVANTTTDEAD